MESYDIAVIGGNGVVGRALINSLDLNSIDYLNIIDPTIKEGNMSTSKDILNSFDIVFLCLPTPSVNGIHQTKLIEEYLKIFNQSRNNRNCTIVINSSTVNDYTCEFKNLNIVYNPEFINEVSANDDFINAKQIVIGGSIDNCIKIREFYKNATKIKKDVIYSLVTIEEAINYKYIRNLKSSWNLTFWEIVHDITNGQSKKMSQLINKDPVPMNNIVGMDGFRGFGGKCLPKDLDALIQLNQNEDENLVNLLKAVRFYNDSLR